MGSIDSRLRRLEEQGHRCPECGLTPNEGRPIAAVYPAAVYPDDPDEGFEGDPHEACARCGQPLWTVVRVVYEGEEGGGGTT